MGKLKQETDKLYNAKLATGLYNHYPPQALIILYEDCKRQTELMLRLRGEL